MRLVDPFNACRTEREMEGMSITNASAVDSGARDIGKRKILVAGNSHTQIIKDAVTIRAGSGKPFGDDIEVCWVILGGKGDFGDTAREDAIAKIQGLRQSDLLVLSALGTLHNLIGLFNHDRPFQLVETANGSVKHQTGIEVIPMNVLRDLFREHVENNPFFMQMVDMAPCRVAHIFPPPPKESFAKSGKTRIIEGVTVRLEYAPKDHRLALWKLEEKLAADYLTRQKVIHYSVPIRACTPEGFLAPAYHAKDATHANHAFGELLLLDLEYMMHDLPLAP